MKKIVASIVTIVIILTMMTINSYAASVSVSNSASSSTKVGDTVKITLSLSQAVRGFEASVSTSGLSGGSGSVSGGTVKVGGKVTAASESNFSTVTLTYTVTSANPSFSISGGTFFDDEGETISSGASGSTSFKAKTQEEIDAEKAAADAAAKAQEQAQAQADAQSKAQEQSKNNSSSNSSKSNTTTTKTETKKTETKKEEKVEEEVPAEEQEEINAIENIEVTEATNEISANEIITTGAKVEEKEKIEVNYTKLFQVVALVIISLIGIVEAVVIMRNQNSGKRSR